jgi:sarcosine oxidase subunit beta
MGGPTVFTHTGFVNIVAPAYAEHLRRNVEMLRSLGVNTVALTAAELAALQPCANVEDIGAAAYESDSGYADPAATVDGFRRRAEELGARIMPWTAVTKISRRESRVQGVETSAGRIESDAVVMAAGAWSARLGRDIGLDLCLRPKAIDTVAVTRPPELREPHMVFIDNVLGNYLRPEAGGLTLVGVPCQEWDIDPDTLGTGLPPQAASRGADLLTHRIPAMERATLARGYRAFDGYSQDRHAILGQVDGIDGLYLATAFSGSGFKIAPAVGVCMAELITEGRSKTVDIEPFNLRRFSLGQSVEGPYPYAARPDHVEPATGRRA